jgi:hypothetical protein
MKVVLLVFLTMINLLWVFPLSKGDQYINRLQEWYWLAGNGQWQKAEKLENKLNQTDILWFKEKNRSDELKKELNQLTVRSNKTANDWMKIAFIQKRLQKTVEAKESVKKAYEIDPIRKDIEKVYFSSSF